MNNQRKYDSTVARIAGNLLSGTLQPSEFRGIGDDPDDPSLEGWRACVAGAVVVARAIVAEVERAQSAQGIESL